MTEIYFNRGFFASRELAGTVERWLKDATNNEDPNIFILRDVLKTLNKLEKFYGEKIAEGKFSKEYKTHIKHLLEIDFAAS